MKKVTNYQEVFAKVNLYLDNELTPDAERELLGQIKSNPALNDMLGKEKSFREFIKSKVQRRKVSPALIASIKDKIKVTS